VKYSKALVAWRIVRAVLPVLADVVADGKVTADEVVQLTRALLVALLGADAVEESGALDYLVGLL